MPACAFAGSDALMKMMTRRLQRDEAGRVVAVGVAVCVGLGVSVSGAKTGGTVAGGVSVTVGVGLGVAVGVLVGVSVGVDVGVGLGVGVGVDSSRLVNVHFTTSSESSLNVAVADPTLPELGFALSASSQMIELRLKPAGRSISVEVYVPTGRLVTTICPLSEILPAASPEKVKSSATPPGIVCFSTMIVPALVLVKVHLTASPGSTLNVAVRVATSPELGAALPLSSQAIEVSWNVGVGSLSLEV